MSAIVTIRTRNNGPFVVEGPVVICDAQGNPFPINPEKPNIALCRCGRSTNKPFCDGSHKHCDFQASETATPANG
ncbi:MAG TPA: CDGSH iron-sulfur domain-containing protein [Pirellulales bacterium]|nr:CDGSH iron-sulfur domain-containing protein [Pirellulales bacterium]